MDSIWYNDIAVLWKEPLEFWPVRQSGDTDADYVNRIVRFVIYVAIALFAYTRRPVVFAYAGLVVLLVSFLFLNKSWSIEHDMRVNPRTYCRKPTRKNPFANTLSDEFGRGEWPPCDGVEDVKQKLASQGTFYDIDDYPNNDANERQFMTLPNAGYGPDFAGFSKELARGSGIID